MGQNSLVVSVSLWLHLCCFLYELIHAPGYSGEDAGIVEQYLMASAYGCVPPLSVSWPALLGMVVVFNNPCCDEVTSEVTSSCTFAVQVTSVVSNGR